MERIKVLQLDKHIIKGRGSHVAFFLIFISIVLYVMHRNIDMTIGDAEWYLSIGDSCFTENGFNLLHFPRTFRGCLFPLYLQLIKHSFLSPRLGWAITSGVMIGSMFAYIFPSLFGNIYAKGRLLSGILMALIYVGIFGDTLAYTLSDVFATFFMITGTWLVITLRTDASRKKVIISSILSGVCTYIAYNTRAVFLYGSLCAMLVVLFFSDMNRRKKLILVASMLMGAFVISLPQCIVNLNQENTFSARVYTENYSEIYGNAVNLQMQQIEWGMNYNRYGAYLGGGGVSLYSYVFY